LPSFEGAHVAQREPPAPAVRASGHGFHPRPDVDRPLRPAPRAGGFPRLERDGVPARRSHAGDDLRPLCKRWDIAVALVKQSI